MIQYLGKRPLATVNEWATFDTAPVGEDPHYALERAFLQGTDTKLFNKDGTTTVQSDSFFQHIYVPIKVVDNQGIATEFHYYDVGFKSGEIADIYETLYGFNYLSVPFRTEDLAHAQISTSVLGKKIAAIFQLNKHKYYKMIELMGYTYNPLWNVDGVEIKQRLENQGVTDVDTNTFSSGHGVTANDNVSEHQTTPYDGTTYRNEYKDTTQGQATVSNFAQYAWDSTTGQWVVEYDTIGNVGAESATKAGGKSSTVYVHKNAKNLNNGAEEEYVINATDTAFGQALTGGDKMFNEKYVRQGNIGVTKTQELIAAERENLRFNLLKEFFDDINKELLVGVYF